VQYRFVSREEFQSMIESRQLLEYAEFAGNLYGTPREAVETRLRAGEPALLEIELQGARQVREAMPEAQFVFLAPPSWQELTRRLTGRATEDEERIKARLERAEIELASASEFDHVIVNEDVEAAAAELVRLIESAAS
jgi:guanylate kinase